MMCSRHQRLRCQSLMIKSRSKRYRLKHLAQTIRQQRCLGKRRNLMQRLPLLSRPTITVLRNRLRTRSSSRQLKIWTICRTQRQPETPTPRTVAWAEAAAAASGAFELEAANLIGMYTSLCLGGWPSRALIARAEPSCDSNLVPKIM
uniref:Uncharacterized protein n=1 Tax=Macrostomum lignano TaxID=282301 RepID=A0A1I8HNM4_9PLAT